MFSYIDIYTTVIERINNNKYDITDDEKKRLISHLHYIISSILLDSDKSGIENAIKKWDPTVRQQLIKTKSNYDENLINFIYTQLRKYNTNFIKYIENEINIYVGKISIDNKFGNEIRRDLLNYSYDYLIKGFIMNNPHLIKSIGPKLNELLTNISKSNDKFADEYMEGIKVLEEKIKNYSQGNNIKEEEQKIDSLPNIDQNIKNEIKKNNREFVQKWWESRKQHHNIFMSFLQSLLNTLKKNKGKVIGGTIALGSISAILKGIFDKYEEQIVTSDNPVLELNKYAPHVIVDATTKVMENNNVQVNSEILNIIKNNAENAMNGINDIFQKINNSINNSIDTANNISNKFNDTINYGTDITKDISEKISDGFKKGINLYRSELNRSFDNIAHNSLQNASATSDVTPKEVIESTVFDKCMDQIYNWIIRLIILIQDHPIISGVITAGAVCLYYITRKHIKNKRVQYVQDAYGNIPFFIYNNNENKITFKSNDCLKDINENEICEYIKSLKTEDKNELTDIINSQNNNIYIIKMQNIIDIGISNGQNILNIPFNQDFINKFNNINEQFSPKLFIKYLILMSKVSKQPLGILFRDISKLFKESYTVNLNNKINSGETFNNLISNINDTTYNNMLKSFNTNINNGLIYYTGIKGIKNIKIDDINNYKPFININKTPDVLPNFKDNVGILIDNNENIHTLKTDAYFDKPLIKLNNIKTKYISDIENENIENDELLLKGGLGGGTGAIIGSAFNNPIFQQWAEEFCNLHPVVGPILRPILQNPKTSGAIIGTLISMGMKPLANKLINFFRLKENQK